MRPFPSRIACELSNPAVHTGRNTKLYERDTSTGQHSSRDMGKNQGYPLFSSLFRSPKTAVNTCVRPFPVGALYCREIMQGTEHLSVQLENQSGSSTLRVHV